MSIEPSFSSVLPVLRNLAPLGADGREDRRVERAREFDDGDNRGFETLASPDVQPIPYIGESFQRNGESQVPVGQCGTWPFLSALRPRTCSAERFANGNNSNQDPISRGSVNEIAGTKVIIISAAKIAK